MGEENAVEKETYVREYPAKNDYDKAGISTGEAPVPAERVPLSQAEVKPPVIEKVAKDWGVDPGSRL